VDREDYLEKSYIRIYSNKKCICWLEWIHRLVSEYIIYSF